MSHSVTLPTNTLLTPNWADCMFAGKTYDLFLLLHTVAQLLTSVLSLATPEYSVGSSRDWVGDRDIQAPLCIVCKRNLSWSLSPLMSATAPAPLSRTLLTLFFIGYSAECLASRSAVPPPLNLTINLYERVHLCPDRRALSIKIQPPSVKRAVAPDFQPLKVIWGYRLVPEVGPGFRVFKEESFVCKERKKQPEWKI